MKAPAWYSRLYRLESSRRLVRMLIEREYCQLVELIAQQEVERGTWQRDPGARRP